MAFEIEEVDVEEDNPIINIHLLSLFSGVSVQNIMKERERLQASEEFWSDPCWIKPLDTAE